MAVPRDKAYDRLPTLRSRALRREATPAERKLWSAIRNRQLGGTRFNFQVPIGPFFGDFVARSVKLVIEVDGGHHGERIGYDEARTRALVKRGFRVIRFWNHDVMGNLPGVVETILVVLNERRALHPLPPEREGKSHAVAKGRACNSHEDCPPSAPTSPPLRATRSSPPAPAGGGQ